MHQEFFDVLNLKQSFSYNRETQVWAKNIQKSEFTASMLGIKMSGKFTYVYSNYEFQDTSDKKTFTNEIISFKEISNKKDTVF